MSEGEVIMWSDLGLGWEYSRGWFQVPYTRVYLVFPYSYCSMKLSKKFDLLSLNFVFVLTSVL